MNLDIEFEDIALIESQGDFNLLDKIMKTPVSIYDSPTDKWALRSKVIVKSPSDFFYTVLVCQFNYDKTINILSYNTSNPDIYNRDISLFASWAKYQANWETIIPKDSLVKEWPDFWMINYDQKFIYSDYIDKNIAMKNDFYERMKRDDNHNEDYDDILDEINYDDEADSEINED